MSYKCSSDAELRNPLIPVYSAASIDRDVQRPYSQSVEST